MQEPKVLDKVWIPGDVERFGVVKKSFRYPRAYNKGFKTKSQTYYTTNVDKSGGNSVKTVDVSP